MGDNQLIMDYNTNQLQEMAVLELEGRGVSNTNQQEVVWSTLVLEEGLLRARTNMFQLLTVAIALYGALMVAMKSVLRADASHQVLHMQTVIVRVSSVLIVFSGLLCCALMRIYQKNNAHHPCSLMYVRLLRMLYFLTAVWPSFFLLSGLFVPVRLFSVTIFVISYTSICALIASLFSGIPTTEPAASPADDNPATTTNSTT